MVYSGALHRMHLNMKTTTNIIFQFNPFYLCSENIKSVNLYSIVYSVILNPSREGSDKEKMDKKFFCIPITFNMPLKSLFFE